MSDEQHGTSDGPTGKVKNIAKRAWDYATSDQAKAKLEEVKKKAVEVGGAASAGAKVALSKTGEVVDQAKDRAEEFSKSEKAQEIRTGAKGLWDRSRAIQVRGVPWMESPIVIGVLLVLVFPLGLALLWTHAGWSKPRKMAWTGVWVGLIALYTLFGGRADIDLETADASEITPDRVMPILKEVAAKIEPLDVQSIDYSKGPNGEAIISRHGHDRATDKPTTDSGFIAADGQFRL
ncbi:MAG TPA: hypothetical protein VFT74_00020, partial [Isosphaeraceae bacterium]|nr:hypothetical protein [Isosphaeraceae bacterium]